jgi:uncharacterized protein YdiU (UPF0061 family)
MIDCPLQPTERARFTPWEHRFASLGEDFFVALAPTPVPSPNWVGTNAALASTLGIEDFSDPASGWLESLAGNVVRTGMRPLASVYSGHQFGVWAGQLGDGRAVLLGELAGREIQLKGAGLTPFSRMGDGRAVLRSSIREYLCSEAMHALGIPTSRALCVIGSDLPVRRESMETAAVVTRVAPSFIRFGHFEHFSHNDQHLQLKQLADFVVDRFYPECRSDGRFGGNPYASLLQAVTERTARMVAQWQAVGFCHGVMNTDNMSILGLTIDYGPFQFLDGYDPGHICNHSDHQGRYAFARQPQVAYWNLYCLGQALLPLIDDQALAVQALETFKPVFSAENARRMAAKLGFASASDTVTALGNAALNLLATEKVDFTIFWRRLSHWAARRDLADHTVRDLFIDPHGIDAWLLHFSEHVTHTPLAHSADLMLQTNPHFVLRNHLGELAIRAAREKDFSQVAQLQLVLAQPFDDNPALAGYADFPPEWAAGIAISCSS